MIKRKKSYCQLSMHFPHSCEKISKIGTSDYVSPVGGYTTPAKRGRPKKTTSRVRMSFRSLEAAKPKEKKCVFSPHFCQWEGRYELHKVESVAEGMN